MDLHILSIIEATGSLIDGLVLNIKLDQTEKDMQQLISSIIQIINTDKVPKGTIVYDEVVPGIMKYVKENDIDAIVIGSKGTNAASNFFFGSTAIKTIEEANIPVCVIPNNAPSSFSLERILLGLDTDEINNEGSFSFLKELSRIFKTKVDLLHVFENKVDQFPFDPFITNYLKEEIGEADFIESNNFETGLKDYVYNKEYHLLVLLNRNKSLLKKWFTKNHIKSSINAIKIPILILPEQ